MFLMTPTYEFWPITVLEYKIIVIFTWLFILFCIIFVIINIMFFISF